MLLRFGFNGDFLQAVDAPLAEQRWLVVIVFFDFVGRGFDRCVTDTLKVGACQHFTACCVQLLNHFGVAVELDLVGLLHRQFLVDQAFKYLL